MRTSIYYFTSTGNSLKIARDLARELGDGTDLTFIPDVIKKDEISTDADRVGIVYPVYMFGEPLIVSEFMGKLALKDDAYVFAVTNYGGTPGAPLQQTEGELKRAGLELSAGFRFRMPNNYTPLKQAPSENKQKKMFSKEAEKVKEIAGIVKEKKKVAVSGFFLWVWIARLLWKIFAPMVPSCDKSFWVTDDCTSCGLCEKVCPVDNIIMESGRPKWMGKCQSCLACLQWCPAEAVQYGKNTKGRRRYHHPEVNVNDIMRHNKI